MFRVFEAVRTPRANKQGESRLVGGFAIGLGVTRQSAGGAVAGIVGRRRARFVFGSNSPLAITGRSDGEGAAQAFVGGGGPNVQSAFPGTTATPTGVGVWFGVVVFLLQHNGLVAVGTGTRNGPPR